jgi:hypothetical protein
VFVLGKPFQPNTMFVSKAEAYLSGTPSIYGRLLALSTKILERFTRENSIA